MRLRVRRAALVLAAALAVVGVGAAEVPSAGSVQPLTARYGQKSTVGALFTLTSAGQLGTHFCTASVVDSPAGDLLVTAAHCMNRRTPGEVAFVPGYSRGQEPFGVWTVSRIIEDQSWISSADPDDDFAFLVVHQAGAGGGIQKLTGGEAVGVDVPAGQTVTVDGYPDARDQMISCANTATAFSPTQYQFDCGGYTGGTSGSPLLTDAGTPGGRETVIGVIGGYQGGGYTPSVSYAAKFSTSLSALYKAALGEAGSLPGVTAASLGRRCVLARAHPSRPWVEWLC
ncbi:MAG TPA: trypsin-like peptidase domain-containing protein [Streptosporangiaceae bacterium]|nr:trypsin-like peptidase domain-containing protein [Streptosporangiaceae bacterium]